MALNSDSFGVENDALYGKASTTMWQQTVKRLMNQLSIMQQFDEHAFGTLSYPISTASMHEKVGRRGKSTAASILAGEFSFGSDNIF